MKKILDNREIIFLNNIEHVYFLIVAAKMTFITCECTIIIPHRNKKLLNIIFGAINIRISMTILWLVIRTMNYLCRESEKPTDK